MSKKDLIFKKTLVAHALAVAFGVGVVAVGVSPSAMAQSSATGYIYGHADSAAGASIVLTNPDTGAKRATVLDANGNYRVTALPVGHYKVDLMRDGKSVNSSEVDVVLGQGAEASFASATVQSVQVVGTRSRIDVSNTNNGAVFTAKELAKLPVAQSLTAIVLLAPNTTRGDSAYGNVASIGGGGVSENAYYINGMPVTNPLTQLGSSQLPWGSIAQASVITGGFGAEFGRSIGGVMNIITKSGTNNWEAGATYSLTPNKLNSTSKNIYSENTGSDDKVDGKIHFKNDNSKNSATQYGGYVGGPLIADKLFMFTAVEKTISKSENLTKDLQAGTNIEKNGWNRTNTETVRYLAKFNWNLTDNHSLEFTSIGDNTRAISGQYGYAVAPGSATFDGTPNNVKYTETNGKNVGSTGANSNAIKYTGQITDALTLTAVLGELKAPRGITYFGSDPNNGTIQSVLVSGRGRVPALDALGLYSVNANKYGGNLSRPGQDKVDSLRLDLEYKLGDHTLRAGLDSNTLESSNAGAKTSGGGAWSFRRIRDSQVGTQTPSTLSGGRSAIVANFGGYGTEGFYVRNRFFNSLTEAKATQSAQYFEDRYQVTKNLLIIGGLRNDQYSNTSGDGDKFIDMKNQLAPRLSAAWDVTGDASTKVFGSVGRYFLQLPTQVAARAASRSTLTDQDFTYSGIDANGQPTGLRAINTAASPDGESGARKDPRSVVQKNLKPNYQDELTLGFEKAVTQGLNVGFKLTYRKLGAGIDDNCDTRTIAAYSQKVGLSQAGSPRDYLSCWIFNPGTDSTIWVESHDAVGNATGNGRYVTFTAKELGFPKAERKYTAIDLFAEHAFRNSWYGKVNYTWSKSKGNMEGQTNSDTGQSDVATTANWDFPEFMTFTNGVLPNDRTHAIKAFGFYELSKEWNLGANILVQSGRPKTCQGTDLTSEEGANPNFPIGADWGGPGYGAAYMFCGGKPAPRGSLGRMPIDKKLDLSLTYKPASLTGLLVGVDVFNVTNGQGILSRQETYDDGSGAITGSYGEVRQYASPRSVKLRVEYNHKF